MLLCHLLFLIFSFSPFTDINNSGEIDKKDFEIAIQVSKKKEASTVVTTENILQLLEAHTKGSFKTFKI